MKRIMMAMAAALMLAGCGTSDVADYEAPKAPEGTQLISVREVGSPKDYVKFHNASEAKSIDATVFFHDVDARIWKKFGFVRLKGPGDTDTISDAMTDIGIRRIRYFAVQFKDGKSHTLSLANRRNDLHVFVED